MAPPQYTTMDPEARDALLGRQEVGVLALAYDDRPYAIPVSYGYDPEERVFYFRLVSTDDSEKRQFLGATPAARLVVTEHRDGIHRSVVAEGPLTKVFRDELTPEDVHQYSEAKRPLLELWESGDIDLYELAAETLSGRAFDVSLE